jgi:fucose permease
MVFLDTAYLVVAPPAGILMRKYGYKKGIHAGLTCYR